MHVDAWQKPTQYGKTIVLQLKVNNLKKKRIATLIKYACNGSGNGGSPVQMFLVPCRLKSDVSGTDAEAGERQGPCG